MAEELISKEGIAHTYNRWEAENADRKINRKDFYIRQLQSAIDILSQKTNITLTGTPVIISGMASSSIGLTELPYASLPFTLDGSDAIFEKIEGTEGFPHEIVIISGVAGEDDVMRGEETQLIGLSGLDDTISSSKMVYIFPGTHSKHLIIEKGKLVDFKTYMTGEIFELLITGSTLRTAVQKPDDGQSVTFDEDAFHEGVLHSENEALLNSLFSVRAKHLHKKMTNEQNYFYLSGLMIGSELRSLRRSDIEGIRLCSGSNLFPFYRKALTGLNMMDKVTFAGPEIVDSAVIRGQLKIFEKNNIKH